jgi:hypothetical protein
LAIGASLQGLNNPRAGYYHPAHPANYQKFGFARHFCLLAGGMRPHADDPPINVFNMLGIVWHFPLSRPVPGSLFMGIEFGYEI